MSYLGLLKFDKIWQIPPRRPANVEGHKLRIGEKMNFKFLITAALLTFNGISFAEDSLDEKNVTVIGAPALRLFYTLKQAGFDEESKPLDTFRIINSEWISCKIQLHAHIYRPEDYECIIKTENNSDL